MKCQNQISDQRMSDIYGLSGIDITGWVEQEIWLTQAMLFKLELGIKTVGASPLSEIPVHLITTSWDQFWSRSEDGKAKVAQCRAAFGGCALCNCWHDQKPGWLHNWVTEPSSQFSDRESENILLWVGRYYASWKGSMIWKALRLLQKCCAPSVAI